MDDKTSCKHTYQATLFGDERHLLTVMTAHFPGHFGLAVRRALGLIQVLSAILA
jgi:hypothetical protein